LGKEHDKALKEDMPKRAQKLWEQGAVLNNELMDIEKKIREAEQEWVPYCVVIGEKEVESGLLSVRDREIKGAQQNMTVDELVTKITLKIAGKPFKPIPLPRNLSKRPQFHG